jgi:transcriptional regulator with XRE-family HTH domain
MSKKTQSSTRDVQVLPYLIVTEVPCEIDPEFGSIVSGEALKQCERIAAEALILKRIPIAGREIKFLRKAAGLTLQELADKVGIKTTQTILNWEKEENERLSNATEVAIRLIIGEKLGLQFVGGFSDFLGLPQMPTEILRINIPSKRASSASQKKGTRL